TATVARAVLPASRSSRLTPELRSECTVRAGAHASSGQSTGLRFSTGERPHPGVTRLLVRRPPQNGQNSLGGRASGRAVQSSWLGRSLAPEFESSFRWS